MLLKAYAVTVTHIADLRDRLREHSGATAVEYALMLALIAAVIVGAVALLGSSTNNAFSNYNSDFAAAS